MRYLKKYPLMLALSLMLLAYAQSHDLWIEKEQNTFKLLYGHKHSSHGGDAYMEYKPEFVKSIKCLSNSKIQEINFEKKYPVQIDAKCDIAFVVFSSGYWTKTVYGTKNVPKDNEKNVIKSWFSEESVKYIDKYTESCEKPMTENLEIVPLVDVSKLKKGDKIRLQVYYKGKPANNVVVAYGDEPKGSTDEEGKINIRINHDGFQIISASLSEPADGVKADEIIYTTSLNFILGK